MGNSSVYQIVLEFEKNPAATTTITSVTLIAWFIWKNMNNYLLLGNNRFIIRIIEKTTRILNIVYMVQNPKLKLEIQFKKAIVMFLSNVKGALKSDSETPKKLLFFVLTFCLPQSCFYLLQ